MNGEGWRGRVALEVSGYLLLLMSFQLSPRVRSSRACFAPYLCFKSGEIVGRWEQHALAQKLCVTGSVGRGCSDGQR